MFIWIYLDKDIHKKHFQDTQNLNFKKVQCAQSRPKILRENVWMSLIKLCQESILLFQGIFGVFVDVFQERVQLVFSRVLHGLCVGVSWHSLTNWGI